LLTVGDSKQSEENDVLDDLLGELFGEVVLGRLGRSRRAQLLARMFFGLFGAGLGIAGALHFMRRPDLTDNTPMWISMIAVFAFLASFSLFNVGLGRTWRWPGKLFVVSFVALFVTRILFGR
jgi:hypothetical protein